MSYDCYCDYDPPEFFERRIRAARKRHRCYECGGSIREGERYEYMAGKWDGEFSAYKICERCRDIRVWVKNSVPCFCYVIGDLYDTSISAIDDAEYRAPEEARGVRFGFLRRIVLRDRFNRRDHHPQAG